MLVRLGLRGAATVRDFICLYQHIQKWLISGGAALGFVPVTHSRSIPLKTPHGYVLLGGVDAQGFSA